MSLIHATNPRYASLLHNFFNKGYEEGRRTWDPGLYLYENNQYVLRQEVVAFQSKSNSKIRFAYIGAPLGKGSFGTVKVVDYTLSANEQEARLKQQSHKTGLKRAVKIQKVAKKSEIRDIENEYQFSAKVGYLHPKRPMISEGKSYMVMHLLKGLSFYDIIVDDYDLSLADRFEITLSILDELVKIHQKGLLHRDIKPENIIINLECNPILARFIDFGLSVEEALLDGRTPGSPFYAAPEMITGNAAKQSSASDLFSVGRTLLLLWGIGEDTYTEEKMNIFFRNIFDLNKSSTLLQFPGLEESTRASIRSIFDKMLEEQPKNRVTAQDALIRFQQSYNLFIAQSNKNSPSPISSNEETTIKIDDPSDLVSETAQETKKKTNFLRRCWRAITGFFGRRSRARKEQENITFIETSSTISIATDRASIDERDDYHFVLNALRAPTGPSDSLVIVNMGTSSSQVRSWERDFSDTDCEYGYDSSSESVHSRSKGLFETLVNETTKAEELEHSPSPRAFMSNMEPSKNPFIP